MAGSFREEGTPPSDIRPPPRRQRRRRGGAAAALARLSERLTGDHPSLDDILRALGPTGPGLLMLLFALPELVPVFGVPTGIVTGSAIGLLAVRLLMVGSLSGGLRLPGWLGRKTLPRTWIVGAAVRAGPWLGRLEALTVPRLRRLTGARARAALGVPLLGLAVVILLPIPLGNQFSGLAVTVLAVGVMARDGAVVLAGLAFAAFAMIWAVLVISAGVGLAGAAFGL